MLPPTERAGEPQWRQAAAPSSQDRCDTPNKCEIGRDAYPTSDHREVGIGAVVVANVWLAFYVIVAVYALASGS